MNLKLKILLVTESHISGSLVSLKLKSMGYAVFLVHSIEKGIALFSSNDFNVVILEAVRGHKKLESLALKAVRPVVFLDSSDAEKKKNSLKITFQEEEFLQLISFMTDTGSLKKKGLTVIDSVISHYGGDKALAQKVCHAFLKEWELDINKITAAFENDEDGLLTKKIHSFKGVLSALGKTEAAKCILKMEILIKGQQRHLALGLMEVLLKECQKISLGLGDLSALS